MIAASFFLSVLLAQTDGAAPSPPDQAFIRLQEEIRKAPQVESNYTELGNLLLRTQNFNEAVVILEVAQRRFPQSAQTALSLGVAYYGLRRFPDAVGAFLQAGKLNTDVEQPVVFLARVPENWGDRRPEVIAFFRKYAALHAGSAVGHMALGQATGDVAELRKAIKLNPRLADAHIAIGTLLETQRDLPGAVTAFQRAAELRPRDPNPHYRLARLYARTGDATRADAERTLHEKLLAEEKAELDRRQAATQHLRLTVRP